MKYLYNIIIQIYFSVIKLLSFKNKKAELWIEGRKNIFKKLEIEFALNNSKIIWIHCASLGEFEQAKPLIIKLYENYILNNNSYKILLTFFSPSGYEIGKNYQYANFTYYLPLDTETNAKQFYSIVNPSLIVFVKYEFWYYYFNIGKKLQIPILLISAIFRDNQIFFKWYGSFFRKMLACVECFFVQNKESYYLLSNIINKEKIKISGDTRFDRVVEIATYSKSFSDIESYIENCKVIIAGSNWIEDDEVLEHFINKNTHIKFIIAPHEISKSRIDDCLRLYKNAVLYSNLKAAKSTTNVIILDNIGTLSSLYKYATICYVGGGFGADGVHNVLEPAVYGKPIVFGNVFEKFYEAVSLINLNAAFSVENALELEKIFDSLLNDSNVYELACKNAKEYVYSNIGSTSVIMSYISENLLFTKE